MNTERAKQIIESPETIPVHYEGKPVWIERVNEASGTATVQIESKTHQVPLRMLEEDSVYNA